MINKRFRGVAIRLFIALAVMTVLAMHVRGDFRLGVLSQVERYLYDARLRMTMPNQPLKTVVIVDIDEKSIAELGHWPWSRDVVAQLVDKLFDEYGIRVLGFDVVFAEAYEASALKVLDALRLEMPELNEQQLGVLTAQAQRWDTDETLANSLVGRNVVLGTVFKQTLSPGEPATTGDLPPPYLQKGELASLELEFAQAAGYVGAYALHMQAANRGGFFSNPSVDKDGVFRRVPMLQMYNGDVYRSLSLAVAQLALGEPPLQFVFADPNGPLDGLSLEGLKIADQFIPVDEHINVLVPYQGGSGTYKYISVIDVLNGSADIEDLFDAVVLVGTSAPGLLDLRATPVASAFVGVEVHANIIHGILHGGIKQSPQFLLGVELLALLVVALLVSLLTLQNAAVGVLGLVGMLVGLFYLGVLGWTKYDLDVPIASSMALAVLLFVLQFAYSFAVESRKKRHLSKVFGQYIPEELVADLNKSEQEVSLEGENREMSVLFSDVRSFTTISEGLDPVELTQLMNEFLTPITKVIHENRGTIDKYMGDAVMAFWGAPITDTDHAYHSVKAGLEMIVALDKLQPHFQSKGWPEIKVGVGVNTGPMNVGNMGSEFRMAYTVLGDTVNLGSRLEGLTKQYGVQFIVSESTAAAAPQYLYRSLDVVRVKGKNEPVRIVEPVMLVVDAPSELKQQLLDWDAALKAYINQQWPLAIEKIKALQQEDQGRMVYDLYLERIAHFQQEPPGRDWDGVFTHTSK